MQAFEKGGINIKNHFKTAVLFAASAFMLSGCTIISGVESYLKPPKLSEQHEKIYNALINSDGSKISLKYPKSGSYLSAFVVADIDDEPTEEAIVFYEKSNFSGNDLSTLRINFLDQKNEKWNSMYDFAAIGDEIERVFISRLGASDITNVIIGTGNTTEKSAQLFVYDDEQKPEPQYLGTYSAMDVTDINNDGENELLIVNTSSEGNTAQLKWLDSSSTLVSGPVLNLSENSSDIAQMLYGKLSENITAVYLDSYINTNTIITEILKPVTNDNGIITLIPVKAENDESPSINRTIRKSYLISRDIDNDGIIEIPLNTVFKGYEDKPETEQINMTNWYVLENNMFVRKYSSYFSITDGYAFMIPEKWENKITVRSVNDDIVFCRYDENPDKQTELMKICVAGSSEAEEIMQEKEYAAYEQIYSYGDTVYLACLPDNSSDSLSLSASEILFNFKIIS